MFNANHVAVALYLCYSTAVRVLIVVKGLFDQPISDNSCLSLVLVSYTWHKGTQEVRNLDQSVNVTLER